MKVKTSKEITDRQEATTFVLSVFKVQGPSVADEVTELFRPGFEPVEAPDFAASISTSARTLKVTIADLVESDEAHYTEKAALAALLDERALVTASLKRLLVGLRRILLGQHDKVDLGRLGFGGETSREPLPLLRQGERIVAVVDGDELADILGEPLFAGATFDPTLYRDEIRQAVAALRSVLDRIGKAQRTVEPDWCRLVGRDDLAERIRPSVSRPGRTEKEIPAEIPAPGRSDPGSLVRDEERTGELRDPGDQEASSVEAVAERKMVGSEGHVDHPDSAEEGSRFPRSGSSSHGSQSPRSPSGHADHRP